MLAPPLPLLCLCPQAVKTMDTMGNVRYPIKAISILKAHGKSAHESALIDGYAINMGRAAQVCRNSQCQCYYLLQLLL